MPVYKFDIQYVYQTEYWTNKLYYICPDMAGARDCAELVAGILLTAINDSVTIDKVRVTPYPFVRNTYTDVVIGQPGTGGSGVLAPLFNVVRWQFGKNYGRYVSHYFRGGITPSNIGNNQQFTPAAHAFNNGIVSQLADLSYILCDVNGFQYIVALANIRVGMHQLRRGSKRRKTPVI